MSDIVEISSVFRDVFKKWPLPDAPEYEGEPPLEWLAERARRYIHVRDVICTELRATGLAALIVTDGKRIDVPVRDLRQAPAIHLGDAGALLTHAWALRGYRDFAGTVFVPAGIKARAVKSACEELGAANKRGRPSKQDEVRAAYEARFPEGHKREGVYWKNVPFEIGQPHGAKVSVDTVKRALGLKK